MVEALVADFLADIAQASGGAVRRRWRQGKSQVV